MRDAVATAANAAKTASSTAAGYGAQGNQIGSSLIPGLERDANNPTGFTPEQANNMLVAGEQGAGGANAGITGEAQLQQARTRNSGGFGAALDEAARDKTRTLSQNALGVQNQSAMLANQKQQSARQQLQGLYGTDVGANLKAQGLIPEDVNSEVNAGKSGWFQNMTGLLSTLASLGFKPFGGQTGGGGGGNKG